MNNELVKKVNAIQAVDAPVQFRKLSATQKLGKLKKEWS